MSCGKVLSLVLVALQQCHYLSDLKLAAQNIVSLTFCTRTGIFLQPGDLSTLCIIFSVSARTFSGHMSILVITTNTGTLSANASPRCSLVIPITPALAPTYMYIKSTPSTHKSRGIQLPLYHRYAACLLTSSKTGGVS